jgi:hypothetical protein
VIEVMATVCGRKSLFFFSDGFLDDFEADTRALAALSREANTAVYFLDVHGLEALPGGLACRVRGPAAVRARALRGR